MSLYKALDAVATTVLRKEPAAWRQAFNPRLSNYDRVAALVGLCERLAPGVAQRWSQRLFSHTPLPLANARYMPYAFGSGATVFRLQGGAAADGAGLGQDLILKVYRRTLGQDGRRLLQLAQFLRGKYATVLHWYGGAGLMIAPSFYFILNAPLLGAPAVGMVQPFIAHDMKDLFLDYTDEALLQLMAQDAPFRDQVHFFCARTLRIAAQEGRCLDFVGRDNVCVLESASGQRQLGILDFGIFDLAQKRQEAPAAYDEVMTRLERCEALLRAIEEETSENNRIELRELDRIFSADVR